MALEGKYWILIMFLLLPLAHALESSSADYEMISYFGFDINTETIPEGNVSYGMGQSFIDYSNVSAYIKGEGIFYINEVNVSVALPSCFTGFLLLCTNQADCSAAGGYWYVGTCHVNPQGGGGGTGGGGYAEPKYVLYPKSFHEVMDKNTILLRNFYIENQEYSSPLSITIVSNLNIYNKQFDVAPGRVAMINFEINGTNKSGYYTDSILVKISKNPSSFKYENISISYYVKDISVVNLTNQTSPVIENRTIINIIPPIFDKKTEENIIKAATFIDNILSNPLFIAISLSILIILLVIMYEISEGLTKVKDYIPSSPLEYLLYAIFLAIPVGLIWWLSSSQNAINTIKSWYTEPLFFIISLSILIVFTIIFLQLKKEQESRFTIGSIFSVSILAILFFVIIKNSNIIAKAIHSYLLTDFIAQPLFIVFGISIVLILTIVMFQISRDNRRSAYGSSETAPVVYIFLAGFVMLIGFIIYLIYTRQLTSSVIKSWYTEPAFIIVVLSLLILMTIILLQLGKNKENPIRFGSMGVLAVVMILIYAIFRNSNLLSFIYYSLPMWTGSILFYVIIFSLLIIGIVIFIQLRREDYYM